MRFAPVAHVDFCIQESYTFPDEFSPKPPPPFLSCNILFGIEFSHGMGTLLGLRHSSCPIHLFRRVLGQGRVDAVVLPPVDALSPRLQLWTPHPFVSVQMHLTSVGMGSDPRTSPRVADRSTLDVATCRRGRCNAGLSPRSPTASSRILPSVTYGQTLAGLDERCACAIPEGSCVELEPRKGLGTSAR